ncbi:unnamed protein product [Owenia fusiformis]|uniref:Uncharacterized protein n=1 Tax=Owenia fusiformis TaxID=6347 RepID=A0A8J1U7W2_OWEFU|nr:unnamed protein product [Owenia fusiformis]
MTYKHLKHTILIKIKHNMGSFLPLSFMALFGLLLLIITYTENNLTTRRSGLGSEISMCRHLRYLSDEHKPKSKKTELKMNIIGYDEMAKCNQDACSLNSKREPPKIRIDTQIPCIHVKDCVTIICKTRHRLDLVKRMILSVWKYYPGMEVIVVDDYNENFPNETEWQSFVLVNHNVHYLQSLVWAGTSYGRNIAVRMVKTKYFFQLDDDNLFLPETNLEKLVNVLENTDISIVAAHYNDAAYFGSMSIGHDDTNGTVLHHYKHVVFGRVPCFSDCYSLDVPQNTFLAKTNHIKQSGGWDREVRTIEHFEFFINTRKEKLKIAVCLDVEITEKSPVPNLLRSSRSPKKQVYLPMILDKWNLDNWLMFCDPERYYHPGGENKNCSGDALRKSQISSKRFARKDVEGIQDNLKFDKN